MVKPAARKQVAGYLQEKHQLSKRRSCALVGIPTCTVRYQSRRSDEAPVRNRLKELAQERPRFGYRRLGVLLRREGHNINLKRVLRLYREESLKLRARKRKRLTSTLRVKPQEPTQINQMWSMDFMHDTLHGGRRFRTLNIVDCCSREALAVEVDTSLSGYRVVRVLQRLLETRGKPQVIQSDNGSEFTGRVLDEWAHKNQIKLHFIEPGKPTQNGVIESFNGKMRDECLNLEWFTDLQHARDIIENWRIDYNTFRPHSSLNNLSPQTWAQNQAENLSCKMG
jgi:putative transposase